MAHLQRKLPYVPAYIEYGAKRKSGVRVIVGLIRGYLDLGIVSL